MGIVWQAPEPEPEPQDPLAAWFRVHFAMLEDRGTLVTQLEGAGPEVGVAPHHALPLRRPPQAFAPTRRKHGRNYDVNEGRCDTGGFCAAGSLGWFRTQV